MSESFRWRLDAMPSPVKAFDDGHLPEIWLIAQASKGGRKWVTPLAFDSLAAAEAAVTPIQLALAAVNQFAETLEKEEVAA